MKKKLIIISVVLLCIAAGVLLFLLPRITRKYSSDISYQDDSLLYVVDNGLYYAEYGSLKFMDNTTGESAYVCNRANCEHNDDNCNAKLEGFAPRVMVYDDYIFLYGFDSEYDGENDTFTGYSILQMEDMDGDNRKTIYEADSGAVLSVMAFDGKVYFTAYVLLPEAGANEYFMTASLYCYDLRWGKLDTLLTYEYKDENNLMEGIEIIESDVKSDLYLKHTYQSASDDTTTVYAEIMKYNIEAEEISTIKEIVNCNFFYIEYKDGKFMYAKYDYSSENPDDDDNIYQNNEDWADENVYIDVGDNPRAAKYRNYGTFVCDEYKRLLYNFETGECWVSNTYFTNEGSYVPDIVSIDEDNGIVYYNAYDFTGMHYGDALEGDTTDYMCMDLDEFLSEYYININDLTDEQRSEVNFTVAE